MKEARKQYDMDAMIEEYIAAYERLNEGHAALLVLELLRECGECDFEHVRRRRIFTTHTPVRQVTTNSPMICTGSDWRARSL